MTVKLNGTNHAVQVNLTCGCPECGIDVEFDIGALDMTDTLDIDEIAQLLKDSGWYYVGDDDEGLNGLVCADCYDNEREKALGELKQALLDYQYDITKALVEWAKEWDYDEYSDVDEVATEAVYWVIRNNERNVLPHVFEEREYEGFEEDDWEAIFDVSDFDKSNELREVIEKKIAEAQKQALEIGLQTNKVCPACSGKNHVEAKFCQFCGINLS